MPQVLFRYQQRILDLLQRGDGFVDLVDRIAEAFGGQAVILGKAILEIHQLLGKALRRIVLLFCRDQLSAHLQAVLRGVGKQRDQRQEELRPDHVHFRVAIRQIHDTLVIELAVRLQQRDQHRVFAAFLRSVLVELFQKVLVFMLGRGLVHLVLHLKHNGNILRAVGIEIAEDKIALAAAARVVVLFKISVRIGAGADAVELDLAVLLQRLAHHLGAHARFQIFIVSDLLILALEQAVPLGQQLFFPEHLRAFQARDLRLQLQQLLVPLVLLLHAFAHSLLYGQLLLRLENLRFRLQAALERGDQLILRRRFVSAAIHRLADGEVLFRVQLMDLPPQIGDDAVLFRLGQLYGGILLPLQLLVEFPVPDLLLDGGIAVFVDRKHLAALRALDFFHD